MWPETPRPALHLRRQASDYADASTFGAEAAYATARGRIINSCLRFLDDCLPKGETARQRTEDGQSWSGLQSNNLVQMVREFLALQARTAPRKADRYVAACPPKPCRMRWPRAEMLL